MTAPHVASHEEHDATRSAANATGPSGRDIAIALSLANISYLRVWTEILGVTSTDAYFLSTSNADVVALMLNVLLLAGAFLGATHVARKFGRKGRIAIISGFVAVLFLRLNSLGPELSPGLFAVVERWRNENYLDALAPVLVMGLIAAAAYRWPRRVLRGAVGLIYILTPFAAVTFGRAAWILLSVNPSYALAPDAPPIGTPVPTVAGPRVVVIVMDALSRYHAIEERPEGFTLPAFDQLRRESLDATQVSQIGHLTKISLPAMLSGLNVTDSDPSSADDLLLTVNDDVTQPWSTAPNLLTAAQDLGGVGILVGWYHPYCRLFPDLDGCVTYPTRTVGSRARDTGFLAALVDQQLALLPYVNLRIRQIDIVKEQTADAAEAVTHGGRGLVFLHLIAPHTPWIWDEEEQDFTLTNFHPDGYFDNIRLMDRVLADLRRRMEAAGKWDSTAVLVLSDHIMRYRPEYLDEPKDDRIPFVLKLPGASTGLQYDRPFSAMVTHELVSALLRGELRSAAEAAAWLDARAHARADAP